MTTLEQHLAEQIAKGALALAEQLAKERYSRDAYTVQETAQRLGFSTDTVRKLIDEGRLHSVQSGPGGAIRVAAWSIRRFLGEPE